MEMPDEADAQSTHAAFQAAPVVSGGRGGASGVERIMPGDDAEHQRVIGDCAGQRANMVEREG